MPFPLVKLVALGLRQMSRHVGAFVKTRAKENERFRRILVKSAGCELLNHCWLKDDYSVLYY